MVAIAIENGPGMRSREVFPLQACSGKFLLHCLHELVDEVEVSLPGDSLMTPSEVLRIVQPLRVVGSHIQHDRQCSFRTNAADQRVQRELADGDAESACALVTDAQNALAVGHNNYINVLIRAISQQLGDRIAERIRDEQPARPSIDVAELLTRQRNGWRVNDRRHFFDVVEKKSVEEDLVRVLQSAQVDMPLQVVVFSLVSLIGADDLLVKGLDMRRKKPVQAKFCALLFRESCAFVQTLPIEEIHAARNIRPTCWRDG